MLNTEPELIYLYSLCHFDIYFNRPDVLSFPELKRYKSNTYTTTAVLTIETVW